MSTRSRVVPGQMCCTRTSVAHMYSDEMCMVRVGDVVWPGLCTVVAVMQTVMLHDTKGYPLPIALCLSSDGLLGWVLTMYLEDALDKYDGS